MPTFNEHFRQVIFFLSLLALGVLIFLQVSFVVPGFLGAVTLFVLNRKPFYYLTYHKKWNRYISTLLLMAVDAIILAIPFGLSVLFVLPKLDGFTANANDLIQGIKEISRQLSDATGMELLSKETIDNLPKWASSYIPNFLSTAVNGFINISTMFFVLFFMLTNAHKIEATLLEYLPLKPENKKRIATETKNIVTSYAIGIPVLALAQGFCAFVGYWIFGVSDPLLWGFITCVCSTIPFVGSGLIWIPLVGYLFAHGESQAGFGLSIYCLIIVLNVDNVLRLFLLKAFANIHPLVTLFGVITGLKLFGFIGLIFGPLLVSYLLLMIRIYANEFSGPIKEN